MINYGPLRASDAQQKEAEVAEQADALRSGRSGLYAHVGSTPTFGIFNRGGMTVSFLFQLSTRLDGKREPVYITGTSYTTSQI